MSKNETDKTTKKVAKSKTTSKVDDVKKPKTKSKYPIEIPDNTIRRDGPLDENEFKYTISIVNPDDQSPGDASKVTMVSSKGAVVVSTAPKPGESHTDQAGQKTFFIAPDPNKWNIYTTPTQSDELVVSNSNKEAARTKVELKFNEMFDMMPINPYGTFSNHNDKDGHFQYIKCIREVTNANDKGEIIIGIKSNIKTLNKYWLDTATHSGVNITVKRDSRVVDAQGNYIGPVTIGNDVFADILIFTLETKPSSDGIYASSCVRIWNESYSRYDSIPPLVLEWSYKPTPKIEFKIVDMGSSTPTTPITSVNGLAAKKVHLFVANEEIPQDATAGLYYNVAVKDLTPPSATANISKDGRSIYLLAPVACSGKIEVSGAPDTRYDFTTKEIPFSIKEDAGSAGGDGAVAKVRVENDTGKWLTINFNSVPSSVDGLDVKMIGSETLTYSKFRSLLDAIKTTTRAVTIPEPVIAINGEELTPTTELTMNNDFSVEVKTLPTTPLKSRVYGIEFRITNRDDSMIENLYDPTIPNTSGSLEHRGFILLNPVVGLHQCKLFGLNYSESNGSMINNNQIRLDDGKNVLIKSDRRKYSQPLQLKLSYRYVGDIGSDWKSVNISYIENPVAPFYYNLTTPVESRDDYALIGMIEFKGKTIEMLKKSTTVVLEELNNTSGTEITTGTNIKLAYIEEEIRTQREPGSPVVWKNRDDVQSLSTLSERKSKRNFKDLDLFQTGKLTANVQYWYSAKLIFISTQGEQYEMTISPYLAGHDLSNVDGYGVIPFSISNVTVGGTSDIDCAYEFKKGQKRIFNFQDNIEIYIYTRDKGPVKIDQSQYSVDTYIWNIISLDQGSNGENLRYETKLPMLDLTKEMRDGRYEVRVSVTLERFGTFTLANREFRINQLDIDTPESKKDPETVVIGEYDGLRLSDGTESEGWIYYGEIKPIDFQNPIITYRGRYTPIRKYKIGDEVNHAGALYICIKDTPEGNAEYNFKTYFRGMNHGLSKALYKSGLLSPYEVLNRLGMDSNFTNKDKPNKNNPSYNHNTTEASWLKVRNPYGDVLYVSKVPVLRNVTLNELAKADMLHPYQRTIRIGNYLYYPRWLMEDASFPYEPLLDDFKNKDKYFQDNGVEVNTITRNESDLLLKFLNGDIDAVSNNTIGVDSSANSEYIYNIKFPRLMRYESNSKKFSSVRMSNGDQIIPSLRLVLERIADEDKPYKNIKETIPGSNEILEGSLDPFADTAFLDYVDVGKFVDMQDVLTELNFMEGLKIQSLGFYKFYHQGQILFISDGLNLKDVTLERLDRHNLVNYSPRVTDIVPVKQQSLDKVGRFIFSRTPYSISLIQALNSPLILSEKNVNGSEIDIFTNQDGSIDLALATEASFTNTLMSIAISKEPTIKTEGYKGRVPDLDLSSVIRNIGTGSSREGVMTRTIVKNTNEIVTQNDDDFFRINKMPMDGKGRVMFVISTPATSLRKTNKKI